MLFGVLAVLTWAMPSPAQDLAAAQATAAEGDRAYEAGDYAGAARAYRDAIERGLDHSVLHYNLGNAYFKLGELGEAIVEYNRALRRNPRDAATRANLERARSLIQDEALAPLSLPVFLRPLAWLYTRLSLDEWVELALLAWFALCLLGATRAWWRPAPLKGRWALWTCGCGLALALCMAAIHAEHELRRRPAVVTAGEVLVRSGPGESYNLSFKVHEGLRLYLDEQRGEWSRVHLGGELVGWVPSHQIEAI
jgi:tetratricopeptide (TPR) repeat protein